MKRFLSAFLTLVLILGICSFAFAAENVDLSKFTYKQLLAIQADLSAEYKLNHTPTDAQKDFVLSAVQSETQMYYIKNGLDLTGWAWYDSEYTYTKDWDFYTLATHLDYKDGNKNSHQAKIYAEVYNQNGKFVLSYLQNDDTVVLDNRANFGNVLWFNEPKEHINKETGVDISKYTTEELTSFYDNINMEIDKSHTVTQTEQNTILGYTKLYLEQYLAEKNYELRGYAWYESEYSYLRDWDYYWLESHVDYKVNNTSKETLI